MSPELILVALVAGPAALLVLLRVNAALVFLSLCLGDVLVSFTYKDAVSIISGASTSAHASDTVIRLGLLLAPALLTTLFMIKTIKGSKKYMNILPAVGAGLLTALLVVPLLPPGLAHTVLATKLWTQIQSFQSGIVALSTLVCLFFLLLQRPKHHAEEKPGKKHKG
jgi:hypothetical protein